MSPTPQEQRAALPTGTVTFAFTDIEGSTARWERDRAAMQDAVRPPQRVNGIAPDELARLLAEGASLTTEAALALALAD